MSQPPDTPEYRAYINELFQFPCDFPLKIMGRTDADLVPLIGSILQQHLPDFDPSTLTVRESRQGTYIAVTAVIRATSKAQLDTLYLALSSRPEVKWLL